MKAFVDRFSCLVKGTVSGFDRIVFKGFILPLMSAAEVMGFCSAGGNTAISFAAFGQALGQGVTIR